MRERHSKLHYRSGIALRASCSGVAIAHRSLGGQVRQVFGANERILLRVQVQATGKDFVNELQCAIAKEMFKKEVSLKAGERAAYPFEIDMAALNLPPGPVPVEFRLKARDQLGFNDTRFLTFSIREPRRVLILADDVARPAEFRRNLEALGYAYKAGHRFGDAARTFERVLTLDADYLALYEELAGSGFDVFYDDLPFNESGAQKVSDERATYLRAHPPFASASASSAVSAG